MLNITKVIKTKLFLCGIIFAIATASVLIGIFVVHARTTVLLHKATKVQSIGAINFYTWMPDDKYFFTLDRANGLIHAMRVSIETGQPIHYPQTESFLTQWKQPVFPHLLSPDGRTLLVLIGASVKRGRIGTVNLQSGQWHPGRQQEFPLGWLNDSYHWVGAIEREHSSYLILHNTHLPTNAGIDIGPLPGGDFLGCTSHGNLLFATVREGASYSENPVGLILTEYSLGLKRQVHQYNVEAPGGTEISAIALSPQGDRLVWQVQLVKSNLRDWVNRNLETFWPGHTSSGTEEDALWVSKVDGSNLRELGRIEVQRPGTFDGPPGSNLKQVRWTEDGLNVSFVYADVLYVVRVD